MFILKSVKMDVNAGKVVMDALKVAYSEIGGKEDNAAAIAHIAGEFLMSRSQGGEAADLDAWIALLQEKFGVVISYEQQEQADLEEALGEEGGEEVTEEASDDLDGLLGLEE